MAKSTKRKWRLWLAATAGVGLTLVAVQNLPDFKRYWKMRKM
jgi:hypothetical protein